MQFERRSKFLPEWRRARLVLVTAVLATFVVLGAALVASQTAGRYEVKPEFTTFNPGDVPINWGEIPAVEIRLFYPGQTSWFWGWYDSTPSMAVPRFRRGPK